MNRKEEVIITENIIFIADVSPLYDENKFEFYYAKLSEERRNKVDRMKQKADKVRSLAAGVLLNLAYESISGLCDTPTILTSENGKPYFDNSPVHFNISHSGDRVMCVLSPCEVGCDVESKSNNSVMIARRFFAPNEFSLIESRTDEAMQKKTFTSIWSILLYFLKATGLGISYDMSEFSVINDELCFASYYDFGKDGKRYYFKHYNFDDGYEYSCCSLIEAFSASPHIISL